MSMNNQSRPKRKRQRIRRINHKEEHAQTDTVHDRRLDVDRLGLHDSVVIQIDEDALRAEGLRRAYG
jgi:hypothetical protein